MKKIIISTLVFIVLVCSTVFAATFTNLHLEQVVVDAPKGIAIFNYEDLNENQLDIDIDKEMIQLKINNQSFDVIDIQEIDESEIITHITFLIDTSSSMKKEFIEEIKKTLTNWASTQSSNNMVTLFKFSDKTEILYEGDAKGMIHEIEKVRVDGNSTKMYNTIQNYLNYTNSQKNKGLVRNVAILITDGSNYYQGGLTKEEILENFEQEGLPLYSITPQTSKQGIEILGEIARATNGKSYIVDTTFEESFDVLMNHLQSYHVLTFQLDSNKISSSSNSFELSVNTQDLQSEDQTQFKMRSSIEDHLTPTIEEIKYKNGSLQLKFSKDMLNIDEERHYKIYLDGKEKEITSIKKFSDQEVKISLANCCAMGKIKVEIQDLVDTSMQENVLNASKEITVPLKVEWLIGVVIAIVLIIIFILGIRKVNRKITFDIGIIDTKGIKTEKVVKLKKEIVIGRDSACDITIIDDSVSKNHCKIILVKNKIFVQDCNSLNGTIFNDKRIEKNIEVPDNFLLKIGKYYIQVDKRNKK